MQSSWEVPTGHSYFCNQLQHGSDLTNRLDRQQWVHNQTTEEHFLSAFPNKTIKSSYFVQFAPHPGISAGNKNNYKLKTDQLRTGWAGVTDDWLTSAAVLVLPVRTRFWSRSFWKKSSTSCGHRQDDISSQHIRVETVNIHLFNCTQGRTLWPSFLISSTAWLRRLKRFFLTLCLPGGWTQGHN